MTPRSDHRDHPAQAAPGTQVAPLGPYATATLVDARSIRVEGELDALSAPMLTAFLHELQQPPEVIDCSGVSFMGAAGVNALLDAARRHPFDTIGSPAVERTLAICELTDTLRLLTPAQNSAVRGRT